MPFQVTAQQPEDGLAARTLVHGVTKHLWISRFYPAMRKTISLTTLLDEMDATVAVEHTLALISALGQQAPIWPTALLVSI